MGLLREERGFLLTDLLVGTAIFTVVIMAVTSFLQVVSRVGVREQARASAIGEAEVGLRRMTKELRQATQVYAAAANVMDVKVTGGGQTLRVRYQCDVAVPGKAQLRCVRATSTNVDQAPTTTSAPVVIDRVLNGTSAAPGTSLFTFSPDATAPSYVKLRLIVPRRGEANGGYGGSVVIDDGFYMRNIGSQ